MGTKPNPKTSVDVQLEEAFDRIESLLRERDELLSETIRLRERLKAALALIQALGEK